MALWYKYVFKLPEELEGHSSYLDSAEVYVVYAATEKEARKIAKDTAKEEHNVKIRTKKLELLYRERW